jgi:hypothetical protein
MMEVGQEMGRSEHFILSFSDYSHTFSLCSLFCGIFGIHIFVHDDRMIPEYMKGVSYR